MRKYAPITTYDKYKNWLLANVLFHKIYIYISLQNCVYKLQLLVKFEKVNVIEIKMIVWLSIALFIQIIVNKYNKMIFRRNETPFPYSRLKERRVVQLDFSQISSDDGDFPRIIEITLFFFSLINNHFFVIELVMDTLKKTFRFHVSVCLSTYTEQYTSLSQNFENSQINWNNMMHYKWK